MVVRLKNFESYEDISQDFDLEKLKELTGHDNPSVLNVHLINKHIEKVDY